MNRIAELIERIIAFLEGPSLMASFVVSLGKITTNVDWIQVIKMCVALTLSLLMTGTLFIINDTIYEKYIRRHLKTHKLTLKNNGNAPSIFLLRTVELQKDLAIRFRMAGKPMIRVTYAMPEESGEAEAVTQASVSADSANSVRSDGKKEASLVPNLNDPLGKDSSGSVTVKGTVDKASKTISKAGKTAGFFASIFSNISALSPKRIAGVNEAQGALKDFQQKTNETTGAINTKTNTASNLKDQLGQLKIPNSNKAGAELPQIEPVSTKNKNSGKSSSGQPQAYGPDTEGSSTFDVENDLSLTSGKYFSYDNEAWLENIGKVDSKGGSLNYAQSNILKPGESVKIDVEILNLSEMEGPVSHIYKIEILQIPQTKLHLSAPTRYVSGIVIFDKVSQIERFMPQIIMIGLIILSLQLIAAICYLLF